MNRTVTPILSTDAVPIPSLGSANFFVDTNACKFMSIFVRYKWAPVSGTVSGITITQKYGIHLGVETNQRLIAENSDAITNLPQPTLSAASEQHVWEWNVPLTDVPRILEYVVSNLDNTSPMAFEMWAERR